MSEPNNPNIVSRGSFYKVSGDMSRLPILDHLDHGYESKNDFYESVYSLVSRWRDREGECIEERAWQGKEGEVIDMRHRALRIRFHDTPGGLPDEAWIPLYLLDPIPMPDYVISRSTTHKESYDEELDKAFEF